MSGDALAENRVEDTRWRRLRFTPLRDMLRGRISGRLDHNRIIAEAELPASLADVVRETTRRTRLSRIEKAEVTRELASHFRDGLDAGASLGDLLGSFGDPRSAAYLIRRAKRRCRPAPVRTMSWAIRATLVAFACVFALAAALTARLYMGEPKLTRNFVAEMNAPIRDIPREDRAWPLYRAAYLATSPWPQIDRREFHPDSEHWPELVAFVEENADVLERYRAAAAKPHLGRPADTVGDPEIEARHRDRPGVVHSGGGGPEDKNPMVISVLLPHLTVLREAVRLSAIDAQAAAIVGDGPRAFRDLKAILGTAEHAAETPTLISDLVALAILAKEAQVIGEILADHPETLTDDQLVELSHRLAAARGGGVLRVRIESERKYFEDIVQRIYTDDGDGDGHIIAAGVDLMNSLGNGADSFFELPTVARFALANRRAMMEKYDQLMSASEDEARVPLWERTESSGAGRSIEDLKSSRLDQVRYMLVLVLTPSLSRASVIAELTTMRRDATLTAIACELYRRDAGVWPASLTDLTPRFLPAVAVDRFDGQPLKCRLIDGVPHIYSVGADGDDDGGRNPEDANARKWVRDWHPPAERDALIAAGAREMPDADWVLWPPIDQADK